MEKSRILVVEDEFVVAADLEFQLQSMGYRVVGLASTGDLALELATREETEIVLMDIKLNGEDDGLETARCLHQKLDIPVIFITAYAESELLDRAQRSEPFGYIVKPYSSKELRATIETALYKARKERELRELYHALQRAREDERCRVAREIHDELGQNLTALQIEISLLKSLADMDHAPIAERLASMEQLVNSTLLSVQRITTELRPSVLDSLGLAAAVEWLAGDFKNRTRIDCRTRIEPEEIRVGANVVTDLFRILQECLTNVARHSRASWVRISLEQTGDATSLTVTDNGIGISDIQANGAASFGLQGIRERIVALKGSVDIQGIPREGTSVYITIPREAVAE